MEHWRRHRAEVLATWFWLATAIYVYSNGIEFIRFDLFLTLTSAFGVALYLGLALKAPPNSSSFGIAITTSLVGAAFLGIFHFLEKSPIPNYPAIMSYIYTLIALSYTVQFLLIPKNWKPGWTLVGIFGLQLVHLLINAVYSYSYNYKNYLSLAQLTFLAIIIHFKVTQNSLSSRRMRIFSESLTILALFIATNLLNDSIKEWSPDFETNPFMEIFPSLIVCAYLLYFKLFKNTLLPDLLWIFGPFGFTFLCASYSRAYLRLTFSGGTVIQACALLYILVYLFNTFLQRNIVVFCHARIRLLFKLPLLRFNYSFVGIKVIIRRAVLIFTTIMIFAFCTCVVFGHSVLQIIDIINFFNISIIDQYAFARALVKDKYVHSSSFDSSRITKNTVINSNITIFDATIDKFSVVKYVPEYVARSRSIKRTDKKGEVGCLVVCDEKQREAVVVRVAPESPADLAGISPGDRLLKFNGIDARKAACCERSPIDLHPIVDNNVEISWQKPDGKIEKAEMIACKLPGKSIVSSKIIDKYDKKIGYIFLSEFENGAGKYLRSALDEFIHEDVNNLIIDLRYNGGGSFSVALDILNRLIPSSFVNATVANFRANERYRQYDQSYMVGDDRASLQLEKLIVLSSKFTCSASEMLVASLTPYMTTWVIGEATCGKPYTADGYAYGDLYIRIMEEQFFNSKNETYGVTGIDVQCPVIHSITAANSIESDPAVDKAINFIISDKCPTSIPDAISTKKQHGLMNF